ncbi:MAG: glutathione S-transferase family protein [Burkholderiales bacterium]|nr:glutathione S-transferase family protein [Burkholderiales bacterium]
MKLHTSFGMNPRLVRMFMAEKGIDVDRVEVDLFAGENRQEPFLKKNPAGQTPVLELDGGSYLSETAAICEYLEELNPKHPLIGATAQERAETRMWLRRVEINICIPMVHAFYYKEGYDLFNTRVHCIPQAADELKVKARKGLVWLNGLLQPGKWICGDRFTVADICLFTYIDLLRNAGQPIPEDLDRLQAWFDRVAARPSADVSLFPMQPMGMRG